ncbi:hypothetical protein HN51_042773 [Arachis hypogaea]|uniref:G2/mitotic-specific cyclin S13-7-like isoform X1 n=2 Tax=Arachis ipaensis TaxID=130454 RepID=UPI0007AFBE51|nr:G2/mitotic-specific cyclin S13-7-like isoform X1 [Arachis ipaensis]XP_025671855.1 G2/mitotic-specific cyclin S13-7 isoform X1 [Arachis hypogaea]QHN94920.1 G2/mitotic-specific cyclin [Arachis hypogaea]
MENNRTTGKGKGKAKTEERGLGNRQVLGDISNLEVLKTTDGNHISRPITRKLYAKLLANSQSTANLLLDPKAQSNEGGAAQGNKNFVQLELDSTASVHKKHGLEERGEHDNERKFKKRSCRKVMTLTAEITAQSKAAREVLSKPDGQHVDIDADNGNIDLAVAEYLDDLYIFYKLTEDESRISDYMNSQNEINEKMRSITVDWLIDVHWRFNLMPETIYLTINIIDRYLSLTVIPKAELQLVGICSLLLACKYEEIVTPKVKVFAKLTDDAYTNQQILDMENAILEKLEWYLTVPTPYMFLDRFIRVPEQPDVELKNMVFFLAELGLMHYQIVLHCPSLIAAATVFAARYTLNRNPFWTEILKLRTGYVAEQIMECSKMLIRFQSSAADSKLDTVIQKFSSPERGAVALLPPLDPKHQVNNLT